MERSSREHKLFYVQAVTRQTNQLGPMGDSISLAFRLQAAG
ncbi:MAG TPA: hypothetical protein VFQ24_04555 [Terriglobia bacterium]|nr:hypothetical protein [Terriglobia bacterium]